MPEPARELFEFTAAVRPLPKHDCIGIPVFSRHTSNSSYVPETDSKLNIVHFHAFDPEEVRTAPILTYSSVPQFYALGEPVPIPFWVNGVQRVVTSSQQFDFVAGGTDTIHPVLVRVGQTLSRAQSTKGLRHDREQEAIWSFLREKPTPDRYWVGRFKDLLTQAFNDVYLPASPSVTFEFSELARQWAQDCAAKADTKVLRSFIEALDGFTSVASKKFMEAQTFALMKHILSKPSASRQVTRELQRLSEITLAPSVVDFLRTTELASEQEFQSAYDQLSRSLRMALINGRTSEVENYGSLFGDPRSLPPQVSEIAHQLASFRHREFVNLVRLALETDSEYTFDLRQAFAAEALKTARLLEAVFRLIYPDQRGGDVYSTSLMGIDRETYGALRHVAEGRPIPSGRN